MGRWSRRLESRPYTIAALMVVIVVGIIVRVAFSSLTPPLLNPDSEGYVQGGWDLVHGNGLDLGLRRTPGYSVFIAGAFALLGEQLSSITRLQHVLGVVNAALAYVVARAALGPIGAFVVGLLTAVSGPMLLYEHYVMTETLSASALLVSLVALMRLLDRPTVGAAAVTGISVGIALLCRPALQIVLIVGVGAVAILLRKQPRRALVIAGVMLVGGSVLMVPWMLKNEILYDTFSMAGPGRHLLFRLIRSDDGFSFARPGNSTEPETEPKASARKVLMEQAAKNDSSSNYKRFREELGLSEAETNKLQTELAMEAIRAQPIYFLQGTVRLFTTIFVGEPINLRREGSDLAEVDWDRPIRHLVNPAPPRGDVRTAQTWLSLWDPARLGLLVPALFVLGLVFAPFTRFGDRILVLAAIALAPQILGAAMAGYALRFRYPFDPLIAIVSVFAVTALARASVRLVRGLRRREVAGSALDATDGMGQRA
jgi:4-amino-4-deoxy-L-arabinose transferase-like glycosyltransferase